MTALTGQFRDQVKVAVVMQDGEIVFLGSCCDEQVGDLPPALAALRQQALHVKRPTHVRGGDLHGSESIQ
ncbi:MAG: hypothetical protein QOJ46_799 [bacterium]